MSLGNNQRKFVLLKAKLIIWAYENGYELTDGDAYRDPRLHGKIGTKRSYGSRNSFHKKRLAQDFNLFKGGKYLTSTEDHKPLGEYWKSLDKECTWGGDFKNGDGNHYSYGEQ